MSDSVTLYTILALIGCALAGLLFAWLLYQKTDHLGKKARYTLACTRALLVTIIAFLLFFPLLRTVSYELEKPVIIIGQDNSSSVADIQAKGFDQGKYQKDLQHLADQLSSKFEVKVYNFSDSVKSGFNFKNKGKVTNASNFVTQLNDELLNRNVGAVILATDGIFNRGGSPLYDVAKLKAPVYTIALGDEVPKKDMIIANVNANDIVYLDNEFTAEVELQAFESRNVNTRLRVLENGREIYSQPITIAANPFAKTIPVKIKANKIGVQKYTVVVDQVAGEVSVRNNTQNLYVDVIDARQKLLIAAGAPHPDIAVFKQAITANKQYEVKVAVGDELNSLSPADYGLVVLYQLPSIYNDGTAFLNKLKEGTASVWYVVGSQTNLAAFNQYQKGITYTGNSAALQESSPIVNTNFTAFDIDAVSVKVIEGFDPLQAPFGTVSVNENATIALNQRVGKVNTQYPQLIFGNDNGRKTEYLIGEGIWKWKMSEALDNIQESVVGALISKSVQYLSVKDDKRKFKTNTAKRTFDENENILINGVLYNDSYVPVNTPDISTTVKNEDGKTYNFLFSRTESAYQLNAGVLPAGNYSYTATTTFGGKKYESAGVFYINSLIAEYQQTIANHELLNSISAQTNGKMYLPNDLLKIATEVENNEQIKTLSYEDRKYEELINFKWLFVLIMLLLSTEWFFRKRNGEV
ncbi:MAG: hypothetical protein EOO92_04720 [Pedobacter sp.]|nr:MAG: hypothetical protein EOO92_04720 [Pedobacter sp.]